LPTPIHDIINAVCHEFDLTRDELLSNQRHASVAHPRILAMSLARELTNSSFPAIGRIFNRDQSTVQSAFRRAKELCVNDHTLAIKREAILRALHPEGREPC